MILLKAIGVYSNGIMGMCLWLLYWHACFLSCAHSRRMMQHKKMCMDIIPTEFELCRDPDSFLCGHFYRHRSNTALSERVNPSSSSEKGLARGL
jgi:hypothetical protein